MLNFLFWPFLAYQHTAVLNEITIHGFPYTVCIAIGLCCYVWWFQFH